MSHSTCTSVRLRRRRRRRTAEVAILLAALLASTLLPATSAAALSTSAPASVIDAATTVAQGAQVPAGFLGTAGELVAGADSHDPVTGEQLAAVRTLIEPSYRLTRVLRDGTFLLAQSFYSGPAGVIVAVRWARLSSADALPTALTTAGASTATESADGEQFVGALVDSTGNVLREAATPTSSRSEDNPYDISAGCNCETAVFAVMLWTVVCLATAAETGPAAPGWYSVCSVAGSYMGFGVSEYCTRCDSTRNVVLTPQVAEAWQDTAHNDPNFVVSYPQNWPSDLTVGFDTRAPTVYRSGMTKTAFSWGGSFQIVIGCCDTQDRWYDTIGWVQYPVGEWGYARGQILVHAW